MWSAECGWHSKLKSKNEKASCLRSFRQACPHLNLNLNINLSLNLSLTLMEDPGQFFDKFYFEPYAIELAKRVVAAPSATILELGAGTGIVTARVQPALPAGVHYIASDVDRAALLKAQQRLHNNDVVWRIIDAVDVPLPDRSVDFVLGGFIYMFVPDKAKAFAEANRVLKPGGKLIFTTWDKLENNPASHLARTIATEYLGAIPELMDTTATSMSDAAAIDQSLNAAGFSRVSVEFIQLNSSAQSAGVAAEGLMTGELFNNIRKEQPAIPDKIKTRLESELTHKFGQAPMVAPVSALMTEAWK